MNIEDKSVYFGLDSMSRDEAIVYTGELLLKHGFINKQYISSMLEKEKNEGTYLGNGIALPHGLNESKKHVKQSGIVLLHFPSGIDYGQNKVYLLIGVAGKDNEHLSVLQDIAIKFSDGNKVEKLINTKNKLDFMEILNDD